MAKQQTFAGLAWKNKGKKTRREQFLSEMNQIIPWKELMRLIEPYCPKAGRGRQPLGLEKMLRIYLLQIWFDLSDHYRQNRAVDFPVEPAKILCFVALPRRFSEMGAGARESPSLPAANG